MSTNGHRWVAGKTATQIYKSRVRARKEAEDAREKRAKAMIEAQFRKRAAKRAGGKYSSTKLHSSVNLERLENNVREIGERLTPSVTEDGGRPRLPLGPLQDDIRRGDAYSCKQQLLEYDCANINTQISSLAETVLHLASRKGNVAIIRMLLRFGADPNMRNANGESALLLAHSRWQQAGALFRPPRQVEAEFVCELLMQFGADPNFASQRDGTTLLHLAARRGHARLLSRLLKFGGNPYIEARDGDVAHYARKQEECRRLLANWERTTSEARLECRRSPYGYV